MHRSVSKKITVFCLVTITVLLWAHHAAAAIIYVRAGANGARDGSSWPDAFTRLQDALGIAAAGDTIWVAGGTYTPADSTEREATFALKDSVALYGGFTGTEANLDERDLSARRTVLSGEIGVQTDVQDNSYHVVTSHSNDAATIIDGFVITGGNASGIFPNDRGGGLYAENGSPTIANVIFELNQAVWGGAMSMGQSDPAISNVGFLDNYAAFGGSIYAFDASTPVITNVTFAGDSVKWQGSAIYNDASFPQVTNTIIWGNSGVTQVINVAGGTTTFNHSIIQGSGGSGEDWNPIFGIDGGNNVDEDPLFFQEDIFLPAVGSPAIDAGNNDAPNLFPTDLWGNPRIIGPAVDIGAYEFSDITGIESPPTPAPVELRTYPNPFNPTVTIEFELDRRRVVRVTVYDIRGRRVRSILDAPRNPGVNRLVWNGTDGKGERMASGVYIVEVRSESWRDHRKVVLLK